MKENVTYPGIVVLGSTGSVGEQALDVARQRQIGVEAVCAGRQADRVEAQVREFHCRACALADETAAADLKRRLADTDVKVYAGTDGICQMLSDVRAATVVNAIVGEAGLLPTMAALKCGKKLALANKESLVVAGEIVMKLAQDYHTQILPVDSEHCAIYQCLKAGRGQDVKKLILTASGGPFFGMKRDKLANIRVEDALAHPTWRMGAKITIDSATLMNKGFEVIEAAHLFGVPADRIEVVVQRESIIHSMVEYVDNSVIAQMSVPDMRFCVQYALTAPARGTAVIEELDFSKPAHLSFAAPDTDTFVLLACAKRALRLGGAVPAVLNAANEVAVAGFLARKIGFTAIFDCVTEVVERLSHLASVHTWEGILEADREARALAEDWIRT